MAAAAEQQPRFIDIIISNCEFVARSLTFERVRVRFLGELPAACREALLSVTLGLMMRRFEFSCSRPLAPSYRVSVTN